MLGMEFFFVGGGLLLRMLLMCVFLIIAVLVKNSDHATLDDVMFRFRASCLANLMLDQLQHAVRTISSLLFVCSE